MTIKSNTDGGHEASFKNWLKIRAAVMIATIVFGIAMILGFYIANGNGAFGGADNQDFLGGFSWGAGCAIIASGIVRFIKTMRKIKDPEEFQKAYTEYADERNQFIIMKTYQTTAYIFIGLLTVAFVVSVYLETAVAFTLSACMVAFSLVSTITYRVMKKKY